MPEVGRVRRAFRTKKAKAAVVAAMAVVAGGGVVSSVCTCATPVFGDTTNPTVSITAPANLATVSGSAVSFTANASDDSSVSGVQFKLDGVNVGAEDTIAPYSTVFDSTVLTNASHTLAATARDPAGHTVTATISVTVSNGGPPPTGTANLFVDTDGGTCTRSATAISYVSATACSSMQAAMTAASGGDNVVVACGTYPAQTISTGTKSTAVTFSAASYTQAVTASDAYFATTCATATSFALTGVDRIHIYGLQATQSPDPSRTDAQLLYTTGGAFNVCSSGCDDAGDVAQTDVLIDGFHGRSVALNSSGLIFDHGSIGNWDSCYTTAGVHVSLGNKGSEDGARFFSGTGSNLTPTNLTIRNSVFHDIPMGVNGAEETSVCGLGSTNGPHSDCMQGNGGINITVENNIFFNCPSSNIQWNPFAGATLGAQMIQNNYFGPVGGISNGTALGAQGSGYDCSGITVRNNYYDGKGINPGTSASGCDNGQIQIYGNYFVNSAACEDGNNAGSGVAVVAVNYHDNAFSATGCGTATKICVSTMVSQPPSSEIWLGSIPNPHTATADTCLQNSDTAPLFPNFDIDGQTRPQGATTADFGPDEVTVSQTQGASQASCIPTPCVDGPTPDASPAQNFVSVGSIFNGSINESRNFCYYVPTNLVANPTSGVGPAVVFIAGGAGQSGSSECQVRFADWHIQQVANANRFIVVVVTKPTARSGWLHPLTDFPAGNPAVTGSESPYLIAVRNNVIARDFDPGLPVLNVDPTRMYLWGDSSGGGMVWHGACDPTTSNLFRGYLSAENNMQVAKVGGVASGNPNCPTTFKNIFVQSMQGTNDTLAGYAEDCSPSDHCNLSFINTGIYWAGRLGCNTTPTTTTIGSPSAANTVRSYGTCAFGTPYGIQSISVQNGTHGLLDDLCNGIDYNAALDTNDFCMAERGWAFSAATTN